MIKLEKIIHWGGTLFIPVLLFMITPIWGSLFEREKSIEYNIIRESQLFNENDFQPYWPSLKFSHENKELNKAFVTVLKIKNSGKLPIITSDFESSIIFKLSSDNKIIKTRLKESYPDDLPVNITIEENNIFIDPLLLNTNDYFYIEILSDSKIIIEKATSRIAGVDNIKQKIVIPYSGLALNLVEPGDKVGHTTQSSIMLINGYSLIVISIVISFITFILFFAYMATKNIAVKVLFLTLSIPTYILFLKCSTLIPGAYLGFASKEWMAYTSMTGTMLLGFALAFWFRSNFSTIKLRKTSDSQG